MPCDSRILNRVKLAGNVDSGMLTKAMSELGIDASEYTHDAERQIVTLRQLRGTVAPTQAQIAQAYSAQVVQATARKYGWQTKQVGKFQYEIVKR